MTAAPNAAAPSAPTGSAPGGTSSPAADPTTLTELMLRLTPHGIPPTAVMEACKTWQLPSVPALNQRPDLVPYVFATLKEKYPNL